MKIYKLIGVLTLIVKLTACAQTSKNKVKNWKSFSESNYSINYPNDWTLNTSGPMGVSFSLSSPVSSEKDNFKENVNLLIQDLTGYNLNLDQFVDISENQIKLMVTDAKIRENKGITTEKLNFQKVIYSGKQGVFDLVYEQYYWVIGDEAYILTLTSEESQFENYQEIGEKIMDSFKIQ